MLRTRIEKLGVHVLDTDEPLSLCRGLILLKQQGYDKVLAEGGGKLTHALLAERVVNRLFLTVAPVIIGSEAPSLCEGPILKPSAAFELVDRRVKEGELHLEYRALPPESPR